LEGGRWKEKRGKRRTHLVASGADKEVPWSSRMTEKHTSSSGTMSDVTNSGIA
jgi:hypothetical protein